MYEPPAAASGRFVPTALGRFAFAFDADGALVRIDLPGRSPRRRDWGRVPAAAPGVARLRRWLEATLDGQRSDFPGTWRIPGTGAFTRRVYRHVHRIPAGEVQSYGAVAAACGSPGAARAVGSAMARNPLPILVPCHRVVAANGLGGFGCGVAMKRRLLAREGYRLPSQAPVS